MTINTRPLEALLFGKAAETAALFGKAASNTNHTQTRIVRKPFDNSEYGMTITTGAGSTTAIVESIKPGSLADYSGMCKGDVIICVKNPLESITGNPTQTTCAEILKQAPGGSVLHVIVRTTIAASGLAHRSAALEQDSVCRNLCTCDHVYCGGEFYARHGSAITWHSCGGAGCCKCRGLGVVRNNVSMSAAL